jgi:endonuclease/exonuclease/phosphatase family protein
MSNSSPLNTLKIATWNMGNRPRVADDAWKHLLSMEPDIALVQEAHIPTWVRETHNVVESQPPTRRLWRSAIVSRLPVTASPAELPMPDVLQGYVATALLTFSAISEPWFIASVHASPRPLENDTGPDFEHTAIRRPSVVAWHSDLAFAYLKGVAVGFPQFIVGGDWNEARGWDRVHGGTEGAEFFDRMVESGWIRCATSHHEVPTFLRAGSTQYQVDHIFADTVTAATVRTSTVFDQDPIRFLSDHAILMLECGGNGQGS